MALKSNLYNDNIPAEKRRAIIWQFVRNNSDVFTASDIKKQLKISKKLVSAGYLKYANKTRRGRVVEFKFVKGPIYPPELKATGENLAQENMWRSMKMLGKFSAKELAVHSTTEKRDVTFHAARNYLYILEKAEYVHRVRGDFPEPIFTMNGTKNTGPLAPSIRSFKNVYDRNTKEYVWHGHQEGERI